MGGLLRKAASALSKEISTSPKMPVAVSRNDSVRSQGCDAKNHDAFFAGYTYMLVYACTHF